VEALLQAAFKAYKHIRKNLRAIYIFLMEKNIFVNGNLILRNEF